MKKALFKLLQVTLIIALFFYMFDDMNISQLQTVAKHYNFNAFFIMMLLSVLSYIPLGIRLSYLSNNQSSARINTLATFICHGMNNLVPGKLGEFAKIYYIAKQTGLSKTFITSTIFWERFLDLNILLLLSLILFWQINYLSILIGLISVVCLIWLLLIFAKFKKSRTTIFINTIPIKKIQHSAHHLHQLICQQLSIKYLLVPSVLSLFIWLSYVLQAHLIFNWVADLHLTWDQTLIVYVIMSMAWAIPLTPGAIGIVEASIVFALDWYGIDKEQALLVALTVRLCEFIPSIVISYFIIISHTFNIQKFKASLNLDPTKADKTTKN